MSTQWSGCPCVITTAGEVLDRRRAAAGCAKVPLPQSIQTDDVAAAHEVPAAGAAAGAAVRPRAPEHGQLHVQPRLQARRATSGPRNRTPSVRNVSTSPLVTKTCLGSRAGSGASMFSPVRRSRTANAVSSALETSTTSGPSRRRWYGPATGSACTRARACRRPPRTPAPAAARRARAPDPSRRRPPRRTRRTPGRRRT